MLEGKKILLAVTGSIAAYKIPLVVRQLVKKGAEVKVIMTASAAGFVSRLTLSTLSKNPVLIDLSEEGSWANHVVLGRWADVMLVAPLSCNTLGKMAAGICDNLVMATYLSATCPVLTAPAMDEDMWHHPATKENIHTIATHGCLVLPVNYGDLASGLTGEGRMAEPEEIIDYLEVFFNRSQELAGKKVLVTTGPTYEAIDPVRFIGNHSSGKMGFAIAEELSERGADVTVVSGPVSISTGKGLKIIQVTSAEEMFKASIEYAGDFDIAVMAAAVADYAPMSSEMEKIKKTDGELTITLKKTPDILRSFGEKKKGHQLLVGFALETENERVHALEKLKQKNADLMVLNSLKDEGAGFGHDTNKVTLYFRSGKEREIELMPKKAVAKEIVDAIIELLT